MVKPQVQSWDSHPGLVPEPTCNLDALPAALGSTVQDGLLTSPGHHPQIPPAPVPRKPQFPAAGPGSPSSVPLGPAQPRAGHTGLGKSPPRTVSHKNSFLKPNCKDVEQAPVSSRPQSGAQMVADPGPAQGTQCGWWMGRQGRLSCRSSPSSPEFSAEAHPAS